MIKFDPSGHLWNESFQLAMEGKIDCSGARPFYKQEMGLVAPSCYL